MKKYAVMACVAVFLFAVASSSFAAAAAAQKTATGNVTAVSASSITVKTTAGDVVCTIVTATKVTGKKTVAEIKTGDKALVTYKVDAGKNVADSIDIGK
ncbi:MAG: hypothetical protein EPN93_17725 [Spirochaetes bacterium]|nr:MAG: hypothetical protein EPN93_17725 [Spirochaetota bacterium]